jgi:hypothetical protein
MPRKPQPSPVVPLTVSIPKPLLKFLEERAHRSFTTVEEALKTILVSAMVTDPFEQRRQKEAVKHAKYVAVATPKDEISEEEIAEAQMLKKLYPPTGVHGKSSTQMKGVERYNSRYRAVFVLMGKRRVLGVFDTAVQAGHAHDDLARRVYGKQARLNFPEHGEISARTGKMRVVRGGAESWDDAPSGDGTLRIPAPTLPGLPRMSVELVPDGKGNLREPPGAIEAIERRRREMFLKAMLNDAAGTVEIEPSNPHEDEEEVRRLRRLAMEEPPEAPPSQCDLPEQEPDDVH